MVTGKKLIKTETGKPELKNKKQKKNKKISFMILTLSVVLVLSLISGQFKPMSYESLMVEVEIPHGSSPKKIARILADKELIHNKNIFYYYSRFKGLDSQFKAGNYQLDAAWPMGEIALSLTKGTQAPGISFTIPEGFNLRQIGERLAEKKLMEKEDFLQAIAADSYDYEFLAGIEPGPDRLEGFLFPDTYQIKVGASPEEIINLMLKRFDQVFDEEMRKRTEELGLSIHELITMASIVEKEGRLDEERPIIAGVFYNRLQEKWRLESCATVQYLLPKPKPELLFKDLEIESPYNTYKYGGLPPGPIASPGRASLEAALYPEDVDYMFFVAEKDGSHYFSLTLKEHERETRRINAGK